MIEEIKIFFSQFGGKENLLYLLLFFLGFFLITAIIEHKILRKTVSFFFGLFIVLQLISLFFTQSFIGYPFFVHCNVSGIKGMVGLFFPFIGVTILLFTFIELLFVFSPNIIKRFFIKKINKNLLILTSFVCFLTILYNSSFIVDSKTLLPVFSNNITNFKEVLRKNKMENYTLPNNIKSEKGKNIIVISLESFERGFLHSKFKKTTPNLQQLKNKWNYIDMNQNHGSEWTSGSLYTYLTGFPAYFGVHGNSIFQATRSSNITAISHILKNAGYDLTYLNGNTNFAGTKSMLHTFKFDNIIDFRSISVTGNQSTYGIRDKDLFELAKKEVDKKRMQEKPFALFISTTDTHFPNGIYDKRMEKHISPKSSNLEFMISAVDYMLADFMSFLKQKNILENTIVYIFPDHLKMGDTSILNGTGERGLYVISNAENQDITVNNSIKYQIDLPKIILNGAKIKHNARFFTDYISGNKDEYIQKNILPITEINTNGLLRNNVAPVKLGNISKKYTKYKSDTMRYIAHAGGKIKGYTYTNSKEALNNSYKNGFRLFELDIIETRDKQLVAAHDWENWKKITNYKGKLPPTLKEFTQYKIHQKFTPLTIKDVNLWFKQHDNAILVTDKINKPIKLLKEFHFPDRLMMELFTKKAIEEAIQVQIKSVIISQNIIEELTLKEVLKFKERGVTHMAISRSFIAKNKKLLQRFKKNGIKTYAYHLNFEEGINEEYVTKYEMDYLYGIYADWWDFSINKELKEVIDKD